MNTEIDIQASVFPNKNVKISFEQYLEVSLDCIQCGRTHRTIVFNSNDQLGCCTPSGHEFMGKISKLVVNEKKNLFNKEIECQFRLNYEYSKVRDIKYPDRISSSLPGWGRIYFTTTCPQCGNTSNHAMQNNTVRPWICYCECGYKLYKEKKEFPSFKQLATCGRFPVASVAVP